MQTAPHKVYASAHMHSLSLVHHAIAITGTYSISNGKDDNSLLKLTTEMPLTSAMQDIVGRAWASDYAD